MVTFKRRVRKRSLGDNFDSIPLGTQLVKKVSTGQVTATDFTFNALAAKRYSRGSQTTYDELHPGPPWKYGGPFNSFIKFDNLLEKKDYVLVDRDYGTYIYSYYGSFIFYPNLTWKTDFKPWTLTELPSYFGESEDSEFGDVTDHGPAAWHKFKPGQPAAQAANFIAEIGDLPRMLRTTAKGFVSLWKSMTSGLTSPKAKAIAEHNLNTQFGWMPFVSDLRRFYSTYKKADRLIKQFQKDNGEWILRKGTVDMTDRSDGIVESSDNYTGHYPRPSFIFNNRYLTGNYTVEKRYKQIVSFSARYRYYVPNILSGSWKRKAYAKLYGLHITPGVVWDATPFTWLVDYFGNVGDVLSSYDDGLAENLATKYAYVMGYTEKYLQCKSTADLISGPNVQTWDFGVTRKQRAESNSHMAFSLDEGTITPRQKSILMSLGISYFT